MVGAVSIFTGGSGFGQGVSLAEAIDQPGLEVTSGGNSPWAGQTGFSYDGVDVARAGGSALILNHNQESWMQITLPGPGTLSYWWRTSSEPDGDFLEFYLNGVLQSGRISGDVIWQKKTYILPAGPHTARWRYVKNGSSSRFFDSAWVDQVVFVAGTPPPVITTPAPSGITSTTATLNSTVTPNGDTTTAFFEYGPTTAYGSTASVTLSPADGLEAQAVSAPISGLEPGQNYYYRFIATNSGGTSTGATMMLTTGSETPLVDGELEAPGILRNGGNVNLIVGKTVAERRYQVMQSDTLAPESWVDVGEERLGDGGPLVVTLPFEPDPEAPRRFYRLALDPSVPEPEGFARIQEGWFVMGRASGDNNNDNGPPPVNVFVSEFFMARHLVTWELWGDVRNWSLDQGYTGIATGVGKGATHPVIRVSWWSMVKWCNARSERDGLTPVYRNADGAVFKTGETEPTVDWNANGYRLPTEAEWEKAARGAAVGRRFPWGDTITHNLANYFSDSKYSYDISPTRGYHPTYDDGISPRTSPVGSFPPNGYGLYDMAGNVWQRCWDWNSESTYTEGAIDPKGPVSGFARRIRGGSWFTDAPSCLSSLRGVASPEGTSSNTGFRLVRSSAP